MVFYVIGLGLGDEKDITVRGLDAVRASSKVFWNIIHPYLELTKQN